MKLLKQSHLKSYGFKDATSACHKAADSSLSAFVSNLKTRLEKKKFDVSKYNQEHVHDVLCPTKMQKGGRVVMPIDYFGVEHSCHTTTELASPAFPPSEEWARPELHETFHPILTGGKKYTAFKVSMTTFKEMSQKAGLQLTNDGCKAAKKAYEHRFSQVLESVSKKYKKESMMHETMLNEALSQKRFKILTA